MNLTDIFRSRIIFCGAQELADKFNFDKIQIFIQIKVLIISRTVFVIHGKL